MNEPEIIVQHREQLAELLTEAAEVEHNLMCCYLFAAWSLRRGEADGLTSDQATAVERWRRAILDVAIDEMTHLANANNLLAAIGGRPHVQRPNFPVSPGYHPAGIVVELRRFEEATIDHFVFLERPEGVDLEDGEGYAAPGRYERATRPDVLMPSAQDYATVGHLYRGLRRGLVSLAEQLGERALFCGDPRSQIGPDVVRLDGLVAVTDLASALAAVDAIVTQGEGNEANPENSHYRRFCSVRDELAELRRADPSFEPARNVVRSPVQRRPPVATGKAWIGGQRAASVLDLSNALYNHMLRTLGAAYEPLPAATRNALLDEAIASMTMLGPLNELLTRLPADDADPERMAGMSFAVTRAIRVPAPGSVPAVLAERTRALAEGAAALASIDAAVDATAKSLAAMAGRLEELSADVEVGGAVAERAAPEAKVEVSSDPSIPPRTVVDGVETIEGEALTLRFDANRCIHARFCVLGAPEVFIGNVQGPWIRPDAIDAEALVSIAHRCPSGAITYTRKDGRPDERPPSVNILNVRENGPVALHADLEIEGEGVRTRATLCRCGASKKKPFCDGSHNAAGFEASGEPPTGDVTALATRNGRLQIRPQLDGPLLVSGNLELCSGTGRTFGKTTRTALCRCGGSANKPFCDGTHVKIGFKSA